MPLDLIEIALPIALIMIMAGVGLSLELDDFRRVITYPKSFFIGALCQLILLPLIALAIIAITDLDGALAVGLFILSLCPGGTTSNLYSYLCKGNVGLSVSLTAVIGFITPFTIPLLSIWAINYFIGERLTLPLPVLDTWIKLMVVGVIPVMVGMLLNKKFPHFSQKVNAYVSLFSVFVLLLVIVSICIQLGDKLIEFIILAGPAVILMNILSMLAGFWISKFMLNDKAQESTITLEVGLQNGTMALLVTSAILKDEVMSIAPSIYSIVMFFTAGLFVYWRLRGAANQAKIKP